MNIQCIETQSVLVKGAPCFAMGRSGDTKFFPLASGAVDKIPYRIRNSDKTENYRSGGFNFYQAEIQGENGDSELVRTRFMFSLPKDQFKKLFPNASKSEKFNFPDEPIKCYD